MGILKVGFGLVLAFSMSEAFATKNKLYKDPGNGAGLAKCILSPGPTPNTKLAEFITPTGTVQLVIPMISLLPDPNCTKAEIYWKEQSRVASLNSLDSAESAETSN